VGLITRSSALRLTQTNRQAGGTFSCSFQMQRTPELHVSVTLDRNPEVELALG